MKASRKSVLALIGAMAMGAAVAAPSVEIVSVQQQYPWTNTVDIVYQVEGVTNMDYFVKFTPTTSAGAGIPDVNGQYDIQVALTNSGIYTAQWFPQTNQQYTACKMVPSVYRGAAKDYMIVDLATGDITYEPMAVQSASNERYNTDEYKTTKMVFRRIKAGKWPVRRHKGGAEYGTTATMDKDYFIGIFEVTIAQYNRIKDTAPYTDMRPKTSISVSTLRGGALAKANVAPSATGDVISRLNYKTGRAFDLPNLAMLQVAAHANASESWSWFFGDTDTNLNKYAISKTNGGVLSVVGSLGNASANPWGLFDIYGNVGERCRDAVTYAAWQKTVGNDTDDVSLTQEPTQIGKYALVHANSYAEPASLCRTSCCSRDLLLTNGTHTHLGFRLALIVE